MGLFRCYRCQLPGLPGQCLEFESDTGACPRCDAAFPAVLPLVAVHYLVPDPRGQILGVNGRYRIACDRFRDHLGLTLGGQIVEQYHATGDYVAVSCRSCRGTPEYLERLKADQALEQMLSRRQALSDDCPSCG